ncbi:MAG: DNA photolyase family protein [Saprospiraceae bacterium]|nr:DNA photolyase family protein [Saprospiraceae bacterium]MCF8249701.1 DNA photolyase family protein [Saprospiraceae bacterium]MCF8279860.1 DNA photolyase family protein [Bacteroidales bacterium]MCF8312312.1 DNA photolyase family protein [Saprospiraceae bacterium]MCF8440691.1 DNA photolyase family protein [Saprospiraceae bacterium]
MQKVNIFWVRRDLRLQDNAGLFHALKAGLPILPIFIFDKDILDDLENQTDPRVTFIHQEVTKLYQELAEHGSTILVKYGKPLEVWEQIAQTYQIEKVFINHDLEPYAIQRDEGVKALLAVKGISFQSFKDHVIFEKNEVLKDDGLPYTVFTPYHRKWLAKLDSRITKWKNNDGENVKASYYLKPYPTLKYADNFLKINPLPLPKLSEMGFELAHLSFPPSNIPQGIIRQYNETRDYPAKDGTSKLGVHFRFGTISIREKALGAFSLNKTFLNELIWRDFYAMILAHFPHVVGQPFRQEYDAICWRNNELEFQAWCEGKTGYPIVDAGMRELNNSGYMHNRVRMVTASFLTKHLLVDWRWGEAYFAKKLLDYDLASNNGGWQWAAGCGTDAAPYFRIFNPTTQQEKFDKDLKYVKKWVPEYGTSEYPEPIVEHKMARVRCLEVYKAGLRK